MIEYYNSNSNVKVSEKILILNAIYIALSKLSEINDMFHIAILYLCIVHMKFLFNGWIL